MAKYMCQICGHIYDEKIEKNLFSELPDDWKCPMCGAEKTQFKEVIEEDKSKEEVNVIIKKENIIYYSNDEENERYQELTNPELYILFMNLAKGCEKQYKYDEQDSFLKIADYYLGKIPKDNNGNIQDIINLLNSDLNIKYTDAFKAASIDEDRGSLRVLTWSEKVSKQINSLLYKYKNEGINFIKNKKIFVCEICGFIYIGDIAPTVCPVCKVPSLKIHEIGGLN